MACPPAVTVFFVLLFVVVFGFISQEVQAAVPAVYMFGDSLVDVGNNNHLKLSIVKANFPHNGVDFPGKKPTGRFSNGKNTADFLSEKLGLASSAPYLSLSSKANNSNAFLAGVSFASGGAGIFDGTDQLFRQSLTMSKQVEYYSIVHDGLVRQLGTAGAQNHLSKSLIGLVIGSNDIFAYFDEGNMGSDLRKKYTPQQYVDFMALTLKQQLQQMYNHGARKFFVAGVGMVGCCPTQRNKNKNKTGDCNEEMNSVCVNYNEGLKAMLGGLKSELKDINYSLFNTYDIMLDLIKLPAAYGFTEVKAACCGLGKLNAGIACLPIAKYCPNRKDHVFWDLYHPTEAVSSILADNIYDGPQKYAVPVNVKQLVAL